VRVSFADASWNIATQTPSERHVPAFNMLCYIDWVTAETFKLHQYCDIKLSISLSVPFLFNFFAQLSDLIKLLIDYFRFASLNLCVFASSFIVWSCLCIALMDYFRQCFWCFVGVKKRKWKNATSLWRHLWCNWILCCHFLSRKISQHWKKKDFCPFFCAFT
jgi:hypothetical protein